MRQQQQDEQLSFSPEIILALERAALERWGKGDPEGFLEIMSPDETYFDPLTAARIDSLDALRRHMAPFAGLIRIERVEIVNPQVLHCGGDLAVLTFNLIDHGARIGDGPKTTSRWNATEVFQRRDSRWQIVHSHWSYTQPVLKDAPTA